MGACVHNFKGIMKAAGLYHVIRWNVGNVARMVLTPHVGIDNNI